MAEIEQPDLPVQEEPGEVQAADPYVLPIVELEDYEVDAELEKALMEAEPNVMADKIRFYLENPDTIPMQNITEIDMVLIKCIISGVLGTPAQRGSITRILNSLKEHMTDTNILLYQGLNKALRTKGFPTQ